MDDEKYQSLIQWKCNHCFRKDSPEDRCMLFSSKHLGVELCLGPFKDQEGRLQKNREDFENEKKPKADLKKAAQEFLLWDFLRKKKLFDNRKDQ